MAAALALLAAASFAAAEPPLEHAVDRVSDSIIQIGIARRVRRLRIRPEGRFLVIDQTNGEVQRLTSGREYLVEADESRRLTVGPFLFLGQTRLMAQGPGSHLTIEGTRYRGSLILRPNPDSTVTAVEELGIEEYLQGVLPTEMSPEWPLEALKAQAVVARTFAINNLGKFSSSGFDLSDDTESQLYSGGELDDERVRRAVRETAGQILSFKQKTLPAFFHSCCGGHTADPASVWGSSEKSPAPTRGVKDGNCRACPQYRWTAYFAESDILAALQKRRRTSGLRLGSARAGSRDVSGRLREIRFTVDGKTVSVRANDFRNWMGANTLKSTLIERVERRKKGYLFSGRGYGHGVGLCQWGARALAERRRGYREILMHYFPKAEIATRDD